MAGDISKTRQQMAQFYFDTKKNKSEAIWCDQESSGASVTGGGGIKGEINLSILGTHTAKLWDGWTPWVNICGKTRTLTQLLATRLLNSLLTWFSVF